MSSVVFSMDSSTLLIEIGMEELPPKTLKPLSEAFQQNLIKVLKEKQFDHGQSSLFATPRRLAVLIDNCNHQQPDQTLERKGPSVKAAYEDDGRPSKALMGFMKSCGITDATQLVQVEMPKGAWLVYREEKPGGSLGDEIQAILQETITALPIAKRMRWQNRREEFVRPVRWLAVMVDDQILPCELFGEQSGHHTFGHRHMTDGKAIPLTSARDYESTLNSAYVIANFDTRKTLIAQQLQTAASDLSGSLTQDEALLDEVTALCEWPEVLSGQFDTKFLDVPEEALISAMREHQRYFHLRDQQGRLQANFLTVANLISRDPQIVIAGNERVIRPRLTDAQFFYQKDLQRPPLEAQAQLGAVVFQQALGSYADKSNRTIKLAAFIAKNLGTNIATAKRAAELAKTDLVSFMVGEFPELQGIMGRYYALAQGESAEVAEAIRDHYLPRFSGDTLPTSATSQVVALADRLDTLVGLFSIGQPPTGSKDPFALRRQALAIVRICLETKLSLSLDALINEAAEPFSHFDKREVKEYILDRFENFMTDQGAQWDSVRAVRARALGIDDLYHAASYIKTLDQFRLTPASGVVIATQKRVQNIISKSDNVTRRSVQPEQFAEPAESALWEWICTLDGAQDSSLTTRLARINEGAAMLARYFEDVMVNVDTIELKENRLNTLRHLNQSLTNIAAFNLLQGAEA